MGVPSPSLGLRYAADTFKASGRPHVRFIYHVPTESPPRAGGCARRARGGDRTDCAFCTWSFQSSGTGQRSTVLQVCRAGRDVDSEGQVKDATSDVLAHFSFGGRGEKTSRPEAGVHSDRRGLDRAAGTSDGPLLRRARPELAVCTRGRSSAVTGLARGAVGFGGGGCRFPACTACPQGCFLTVRLVHTSIPAHLRSRCHSTRSD